MCPKLVSLTSSVGSVRTRSIMNAQLEAQKELFINKLHQGLESGLGAERSQFLTKQKYDEIVKCLQQWESMSAKERKEQWPQGHAWLKKYALFGEGESAVLIFNPDELEVKRLKKSGGKDAAGVDPAPAPVDHSLIVSHSGRVFEDLHEVHVAGGHCKSRTFLHRVQAKFGKSRVCKFVSRVCRIGLSAEWITCSWVEFANTAHEFANGGGVQTGRPNRKRVCRSGVVFANE